MTHKKKYWQLRKDLYGEYQQVADICGVSTATVSRVLNEKLKNDTVLFAAIEVRKKILEQRAKQEKIRNQNILS